jgi:hypothetical protein
VSISVKFSVRTMLVLTVCAIPGLEASADLDSFILSLFYIVRGIECKYSRGTHKIDHILERDLLIWLNSTTTARARHDLKVNKMDVNWVSPSAGIINELPFLRVTSANHVSA